MREEIALNTSDASVAARRRPKSGASALGNAEDERVSELMPAPARASQSFFGPRRERVV